MLSLHASNHQLTKMSQTLMSATKLQNRSWKSTSFFFIAAQVHIYEPLAVDSINFFDSLLHIGNGTTKLVEDMIGQIRN